MFVALMVVVVGDIGLWVVVMLRADFYDWLFVDLVVGFFTRVGTFAVTLFDFVELE